MLKPFLTAALIMLLPLSGVVAAEKGHDHSHGTAEKGKHGGIVQDVAGVEAELVITTGTIAVYLSDHSAVPVSPEGAMASVLLTQGTSRVGTIALKPVGDRLEGKGEVPAGADIVLSLRTKDGKTGQAKYELGGHSH
ncbi:hypothetical protein CHU95_02775 [Niveispirillum lacus]|uniref:Uncharacterized protein n=1 Tax=Niveispirillum lacus TaxID=1981099 RepID=A0A255Z628_9PROT|nr:hypothetical protein [Niveispirillum lacus]OYQ36928.1 hypothetical protein CHU95_02775 [Niveispirillum lacus]